MGVMSGTDVVKQAVDLLRSRLVAAHAEAAELTAEIARLEGALDRLGASTDQSDTVTPADPHPDGSAGLDFAGMSVAGAVKALLEAEHGPWTPSMVRERLSDSGLRGDRSDEKFLQAISTAFYNLRKRGEAVTNKYNFTTATKWRADAEAPVATGASGGEGSNGDSSWKEGGTGYAPAPPDGRGARSGDTEPHHGHGSGASISEALAL
jgi:hypothetical protein